MQSIICIKGSAFQASSEELEKLIQGLERRDGLLRNVSGIKKTTWFKLSEARRLDFFLEAWLRNGLAGISKFKKPIGVFHYSKHKGNQS